MKSRCLARTAAVALGLSLAAWAPVSLAATPCEKLAAQGADSLKAGSVTVQEYEGPLMAVLSWELAPDAPADAFLRWCVEKRHVASGKEREQCFGRMGFRSALFNRCVGVNDCLFGKFTFRVRLDNKCGLAEPWSDPVEFEYSE